VTPYLLQIGCERIMLPNDKGLPTLLKALAGASMVKNDRRYAGGGIDLEGTVDVKVEPLPGFRIVTRKVTHANPVRVPHAEIADVLPPERRLGLPARFENQLPTNMSRQLRLIGG